jgi:hypothetical protein
MYLPCLDSRDVGSESTRTAGSTTLEYVEKLPLLVPVYRYQYHGRRLVCYVCTRPAQARSGVLDAAGANLEGAGGLRHARAVVDLAEALVAVAFPAWARDRWPVAEVVWAAGGGRT